eukprot:2278869-Pleurochrysis_carterae.AAC.1
MDNVVSGSVSCAHQDRPGLSLVLRIAPQQHTADRPMGEHRSELHKAAVSGSATCRATPGWRDRGRSILATNKLGGIAST